MYIIYKTIRKVKFIILNVCIQNLSSFSFESQILNFLLSNVYTDIFFVEIVNIIKTEEINITKQSLRFFKKFLFSRLKLFFLLTEQHGPNL